MRAPGLVAIFLMLASHASGTYFSYKDVMELNAANFDKLVVNSDGVSLFYAPWNSQCKDLSSRISSVAGNLKGIALVGAVDCTDKEAAGNLCQRHGVRGFPSVKLFGPDRTKNPYTGEMFKTPTDYTGDRTSKAIVAAVTQLLTDVHISKIRTPADLKELREAGSAAGKAQVLLFTDKEGTTNLYKGLSMQLRRGLLFGQVHSSAAEVLAELGVDEFPTLLVLKADGEVVKYDGEVKAPALREFLLGYSSESDEAAEGDSAEAAGASSGGDAGAGKGAAWAFVKQVEGLEEVGPLEAREDMALIAVHGAEGADGCQVARKYFLAAAGDMQAVVDTYLVSVPAADLTRGSAGAELLGRIGVDVGELTADPCELQVVLLPYGSDKADSDIKLRYTGPPDGKELQRWVTGEVPNLVAEVDDQSVTAFLTTDPSEGAISAAPKVLLFTNKDEAPGIYRALALALKGRGNMIFGWVQANSPGSKHSMESFKPPKVPSLLVVLPTIVPDEMNPEESRLRFGMQPYFGPLKYGNMHAFLEGIAQQVEMAAGIAKDPEAVRKILPEIRSQDDFQTHCTEPAGMCVLGLLDASAPGFEEEHKGLVTAAMHQSHANSALHFAWLDARKHRSVMQAFGVLSSDLPVLVALSARRMRFGLLHSASASETPKGPRLRAELVAKFVDEVLSAKIRTEPLTALPEIREGDDAGADAAEGGDSGKAAEAEAVVVEEEFDLSDILSEEVEGGVVGGTKAERLQEIEEQLKAEEEARKAAEKKSSSKKKKKKSKKGGKAKSGSSEEL